MKIKNEIFVIIVWSITAGLFGGLVGSIIIKNYLNNNNGLNYFTQNDLLSSYMQNSRNAKDQKKIYVTDDENNKNIIDSAQKTYVGFYSRIISDKKAKAEQPGEFSADTFYDLTHPLSSGVIMTNDGWIMTTFKIGNPADYVVITSDKGIYEIDKVMNVDFNEFKFVHIKASGLPVKGLVGYNESQNGQKIIAVNILGQSWQNSLLDKDNPEKLVRSSDQFNYFRLTLPMPKQFYGSAIFSKEGNYLAFADTKGNVLPAYSLRAIVNNLLKNKDASRPYLGVNYVNLNSVIIEGVDQKKGFMIYDTEESTAVVKNSPAEIVGLKYGDVISHIDGIEIDNSLSLFSMLQNYLPGDKVNIMYNRQGEKKSLNITLTKK